MIDIVIDNDQLLVPAVPQRRFSLILMTYQATMETKGRTIQGQEAIHTKWAKRAPF